MVVTVQQIIALLAVILGGGVGVSLASQAIKRVLGLKSDAAIHFMVTAISTVTGVAGYILTIKGLPFEFAGISSSSVYGVSQFVFKNSRYAIGFLNEVAAKRAEDKAAQAPVTVTPTETAPTEFSV